MSLFKMVEDFQLLYGITLFIFLVIFALCYLRSAFTYIEQHHFQSASVPIFPWGHVKTVIYGDTSLFLLLWKYYNRFRRRSTQIGGFYIFLKPSFLAVDEKLGKNLMKNDEFFEKTTFEYRTSANCAGKNETINLILKSLDESAKEMKLEGDLDINLYLKDFLNQKIFDFSNDANRTQFHKLLGEKPGICKQFLKLIIPTLEKLIPCNTRQKLNNLIEMEQKLRKKTDLMKNDLIRISDDDDDDDDDVTEILDFVDVCVNSISFCLHELSLNEEIQNDLRGEISRFLKIVPSPLKENIEGSTNLSYLESVVCETLRKFPPKPFITRRCKKTFELLPESKIEAGCLVFVSIFGLHHNRQHYTDPETFDPDRFSEENLIFIDPNNFVPFGYSSLSSNHEATCTKIVMKVGLIQLLSRFKFTQGKKSRKGLDFDCNSLGISPRNGLWLNIEPLR